jgi:hypothetical protein
MVPSVKPYSARSFKLGAACIVIGVLAVGCSTRPTHVRLESKGMNRTSISAPGPCPPGCSLPTDHDAITWLASASVSVTIVTAIPDPNPSGPYPWDFWDFRVDRVLEITASHWRPQSFAGLFNYPNLADYQQYLVFTSWRGRFPCVSTLYAFDYQKRTFSLMSSNRAAIPLPGRNLPIPKSITLAQVRRRMYPTGPFVQSTDYSPYMCPQ